MHARPNIITEAEIDASEADQDAPLWLTGKGLLRAITGFVLYGFCLGFLCGAISGTGIYPAIGTLYGAVIGAIAGTVSGIPLCGVTMLLIIKNRNSIRKALRETTLLTMAASLLIIGIPLVTVLPMALQSMALPALLPAATAVGYTAKRCIALSVAEEQRRQILDGVYGRGIHFGWVALMSCVAPIVFWLVVWVAFD